ncbi:MAG: bifunctional DNA-formamidopyrimidine glycosylase/DNA-(apurinic or apyrimidinic site) lyase [Pseudomonadales bacterium]
MPELPEVETTVRGVRPHVTGQRLVGWTLRNASLRWPVELPAALRGQTFHSATRAAKYLLLELDSGRLILHLGMSGSLRIVPVGQAPMKHDHLDFELSSGWLLRFNDPRRFGSVHFHSHAEQARSGDHWLLANLGPEPLSDGFDGAYLMSRSRKRKQAVKNFLMDGRIVVGVGNIYANEALFLAGIRPTVPAGKVTRVAYDALARAVKGVLGAAIEMGGTTLRDFVGTQGEPGYFKQRLNVYGREGLPCRECETVLKPVRIGQRASVYCPNCQRAQGFKPLQ